MISSRPWLSWLLLGVVACSQAAAQQSPATSTAPATGASSAFGSGFGESGSATGSAFAAPSANSSGFGGTGTSLGPGSATSGGSSSPELPGAGSPAEAGPTTFSISTGYGRAPELFVAGEGRLTRPKFSTHVSASIGFDDNIFQTATDPQGTPDVVVRQQVTEGTAAQVVLVPIPQKQQPTRIGAIRPPPQQQRFRQVIIPAVDPEFQDLVIPGTPKPKRRTSAISRESIGFEAQTATRRTIFTFDLNLNSDYFWNRPGKKSEYNGDLAIRYLHRFTPRLQVTASVNASYLSQPDLSQINTPTDTGNGNYLVITAKSDLSYRWTPRFSTVTTLGFNSLGYEEKNRQLGDYTSFTLGQELHYLWSPKLTAVVEGRYSHITYANSPEIDSTSFFALLGLDLSLSRRASASIRTGTEIRSFDDVGGNSLAPYLEATLNYQLSKASVLSWNNRFGFEEPPDANTEVLVFRSSVSVSHVFGPRLRGSLAINGIHRSTTNDTASTDSTEDTLDTGLNFYYTLTRKWSFNLSYTYTTVFFDPGEGNYFRDRLFAGFDYAF